jgi:hypothetical protein
LTNVRNKGHMGCQNDFIKIFAIGLPTILDLREMFGKNGQA